MARNVQRIQKSKDPLDIFEYMSKISSDMAILVSLGAKEKRHMQYSKNDVLNELKRQMAAHVREKKERGASAWNREYIKLKSQYFNTKKGTPVISDYAGSLLTKARASIAVKVLAATSAGNLDLARNLTSVLEHFKQGR